MSTMLIVVGFLVVIFWGLLRLREIRESAVQDIEEPDKIALMLGLFYTISAACLKFYRDRGSYPESVLGGPEGLIELGYLKGTTMADLTPAVKLFSIVISDKGGVGVCLAHTTAQMANEIVGRAKESNSLEKFVDYQSGEFVKLEIPVSTLTANLTIPLPIVPIGTAIAGSDRIEEGLVSKEAAAAAKG
ncbi:MAG: hypothetical protein HQL71_06075 [Magnetococcales bacterium]|nr:hypothetical protein [Magnetococcales bacterium]